MAIGNHIMSCAIQDNKPFKKFFQEYIRSITPDLQYINRAISYHEKWLNEAQAKYSKLIKMNKGQKYSFSYRRKKSAVKYANLFLKAEQRKIRTACKYLTELVLWQTPTMLENYKQKLVCDLKEYITDGCKYAEEILSQAEDKLIEDYYESELKRSMDDIHFYTNKLVEDRKVKANQEQLVCQINQCII